MKFIILLLFFSMTIYAEDKKENQEFRFRRQIDTQKKDVIRQEKPLPVRVSPPPVREPLKKEITPNKVEQVPSAPVVKERIAPQESKPERHTKIDATKLKQKQEEFNTRTSYYAQQYRRSANLVRKDVNELRPEHYRWFSRSFFRLHDINPIYYRPDINWWRAPHWSAINKWISTSWKTPIFYDFEYYPITVIREYSYNDELPYAIAGNWMPLGVFVLASSRKGLPDSTIFMQLALSRNGEVTGTYYNVETDETSLLEGSIDKQTQEIIWKISNKSNTPIMHTGLFNLTQDEIPTLIQFSDGSEEVWFMVRITQ